MFGVAFSAPETIHAPLVIDRSPEIYRLFEDGRLSPPVACALIGHGLCRSFGLACRRGRRWIRSLPGIGPKGLAEIEALAVELGLEVRP